MYMKEITGQNNTVVAKVEMWQVLWAPLGVNFEKLNHPSLKF